MPNSDLLKLLMKHDMTHSQMTERRKREQVCVRKGTRKRRTKLQLIECLVLWALRAFTLDTYVSEGTRPPVARLHRGARRATAGVCAASV